MDMEDAVRTTTKASAHDAIRGPSAPRTDARPVEPLRPLILLPALNEEGGMEATLAELRAVERFPSGRRPDVLVVDGWSTDRTVEVARSAGAIVRMQTGHGKGGAVREGLAWATSNGYQAVAVLDADGTYACDRLPVLFGMLELGAELVVGVRRPTHRADSTVRDLVHRVGNGLLNWTAASLARGPILDVCSGFWGLRTTVLPRLGLTSDGFEIESELFVKSFRGHLRIVQLPVEYRTRIGTAKLHAVRDGARIFLSIARNARPLPAGAPRPMPSAATPRGVVRDLATTLLTLGPPPVAVVAPASRAGEVAALAQILRPFGAGVETVTVGAGHGPTSDGTVSPPMAPGPDWFLARGAGVVLLPEATTNGVAAGSALVDLPKRAHRLLLSPAAPDGEDTRRTARSGGYSSNPPGPKLREPRPLGSGEILAATFETWGVQRLELLLRANVATSELRTLPARPEVILPSLPAGSPVAHPTSPSWSAERP
jgi:hypothetical protein